MIGQGDSNLECGLCQLKATASDLVMGWRYWQLFVNRNQNYLGKVMLVLKRHATNVTELKDEEQVEFWNVLRLTKESLDAAFQPDHVNYAFLMNQDRHVHLHLVPRYAEPRKFAGLVFQDGHLGEHYQLTQQIVSLEWRAQLAAHLRQYLGS